MSWLYWFAAWFNVWTSILFAFEGSAACFLAFGFAVFWSRLLKGENNAQ